MLAAVFCPTQTQNKMKKSKVISYKNLPARLPWLSTAVAYLFLDKFNAVGWVWGMVITLFSILWILCIAGKCLQTSVDVFNAEDKPEIKSKFAERLNEMKEKNTVR